MNVLFPTVHASEHLAVLGMLDHTGHLAKGLRFGVGQGLLVHGQKICSLEARVLDCSLVLGEGIASLVALHCAKHELHALSGPARILSAVLVALEGSALLGLGIDSPLEKGEVGLRDEDENDGERKSPKGKGEVGRAYAKPRRRIIACGLCCLMDRSIFVQWGINKL